MPCRAAALDDAVSKPEELVRRCQAIFNGKNLDGWSIEPSSNDDDPTWAVQDGSLAISSPVVQSGGSLMTDASYRDFELSFDTALGSDFSGVMIIRS